MKIRKTVAVDRRLVAAALFIFYFCSDVYVSLVRSFLGSKLAIFSFSCFWGALLFLYLLLSLSGASHGRKAAAREVFTPFIVYGTVFFLIVFTMVLHPEYSDWFSHLAYGIKPAFLRLQDGIWAFLTVWLVKDDEDLCRYLEICAWILFLYNAWLFIQAISRGYWVSYHVEHNGWVKTQSVYNLEFGYDMLFPTAFMGASAFLRGKKIYYIPYAVGVFMIMSGGSRGALIWTLAMFPMMLPLRWHSLDRKGRAVFTALSVILLGVLVAVFLNFEQILIALSQVFTRYGFSSRSLLYLLQGDFADSSGRDRIYATAIDMIRNGGLFGYGVYGDRYVIGEFMIYGYCHNVFLELLITFGPLGGGLCILLLMGGIVGLYRRSKTIDQQIVLITFLVGACKLMLSNSFWYMPYFWALLALMGARKKYSAPAVPELRGSAALRRPSAGNARALEHSS